jgi:hypothetical protein
MRCAGLLLVPACSGLSISDFSLSLKVEVRGFHIVSRFFSIRCSSSGESAAESLPAMV